jgi:ATP-dependent protease Clp ATPase subunit
MTAVVIPFNKPNRSERKCSFCGKEESKVDHLIHSEATGHCICDKCIVKCKQLATDKPTQTS